MSSDKTALSVFFSGLWPTSRRHNISRWFTIKLIAIIDQLNQQLAHLRFSEPVTHVYNPMLYARTAYCEYLDRYAGTPEVMFVGMNPGPWGMVQTGIPFGDVVSVREWLKLECDIAPPDDTHPKRPVLGFACQRREVSGQRFWGWARQTFRQPDRFFKRFFVANYCPLMFVESTGRNRTPDKLKAREKSALFDACDKALRLTVKALNPRVVIGIGRFAQQRSTAALEGLSVKIGGITHPSPANPQANRNWNERITDELNAIGVLMAAGISRHR